jgi:hypothetical protein
MNSERAAGLHPKPDVPSKRHFVLQKHYELCSEKVDTAVPIQEYLTVICCYGRLILFLSTTKPCITSE